LLHERSGPFGGVLIWTSFGRSNLSHVKVRGEAVGTPAAPARAAQP